MKKPHEQQWRIDKDGDVRRLSARGESAGLVCLRAGAGTPEDMALVAAAPDLYRELAHLVRLLEPLEKDGRLNVPGLATLNGARAALKKAGVLS